MLCTLITILIVFFATPCVAASKASLAQEDVGICNPLRFGTARNDSTLNAAINSTGTDVFPDCSGRKILLIPPGGTWNINNNLTIPARMQMHIPAGASITIGVGVDFGVEYLPHCDMPADCILGPGALHLSAAIAASGNSYMTSGCTPAIPGSGLTIAPFACSGVIYRDNKWRIDFVQSAAAVTLPNAPTSWLAVHRNTSGAPGGCWTRVSGTHYVTCVLGGLPLAPEGGMVIAKATTSGGNVTGVTLVGYRSIDDALLLRHSVTSWGAIVNDGANDSVAIINALLAALEQRTALHFPGGGTYDIDHDGMAISAPVTVAGGAILRIMNPAHHIQFNSSFDAPAVQVFDADGVSTGRVKFAKPFELKAAWWGLDGVPENDVTVKFQAAVDALQPIEPLAFIRSCLLVGTGYHRITSTINMTTGAGIGVHTGKNFDHQNTCIKGESRNVHTRFLGETGASPVFDFTGSFYAHLENITIGTDRNINNSHMGILIAASVTTDGAHLPYFSNILIDLADAVSANGGVGSIGLLVFGSENGTYDSVHSVANVPLLMTSQPNIGTEFGSGATHNVTSQFVQITPLHSTGVNTFTALTAQSIHERNCAICLYGVNSASFHNVYLGRVDGIAGDYRVAMHLAGDVDTLTVTGTMESHFGFMQLFGKLSNAHLRMVAAQNAVSWFELGKLGGSPVTIEGVDFRGANKSSTSDAGFIVPVPSPLAPLPISIRHSSFFLASASHLIHLLPSRSVLRNTQGTVFETPSTHSRVDLNRQVLYVPQFQGGAGPVTGGTFGIARIVVPALGPVGTNAWTTHVEVEGILMAGENTTNQCVVRIGATLGVLRNPTGGDALFTPVQHIDAVGCVVLAGFNNVTYSLLAQGGTPATHYVLALTFDIPDTISVSWTGTVTINYSTPFAQAPAMVLQTDP